MTTAKIVLDTSFGDGGKGLTVDNLCRQAISKSQSVAVVRFSGGQQCGHTVIRNGIKHVFSSYGSGTMLNVPTYYTAETTMFLPNVQNEYLQLCKKGFNPELYFHPHTRVTTPHDVAYNRATERFRLNRHGSCGLGVGATMKRHDETPHRVVVSDLSHHSLLHAKFSGIFSFYVDKISKESKDLLSVYYAELNDQLEVFDYALAQMENTRAFRVGVLKNTYQNLIYEGSQGIMLDMDHGVFPNVTYAHTTSRNAISDLTRLGINDIELYYVSRCYLTRHGRGWMPNEKEIHLINTEEEINVYNDWQEGFRIGELDYELINHAVEVDSGYHGQNYKRNLVLTCLDQRPDFKIDFSKLKSFTSVYGNDSAQADHTFKIS